VARLPAIFAGSYLAVGLLVWISFMRTNPDGLANIGLVLYVFPVTLIGLAIGRQAGSPGFILIPQGLGYWTAHAVFFFPSLIAVAALIYGLLKVAARLVRRAGHKPDSQ
jgi:hypothetical protein